MEEDEQQALSQMSNLDSLHFDSAATDWPLDHLPYPEKLTRLRSPNNPESACKEWSRLVNLKDLNLSHAGISIEFTHLTALEKLNLVYALFLEQDPDLYSVPLEIERYTQRSREAMHNMLHLTKLSIFVQSLNVDNLRFLPHLTSLRDLSIEEYSTSRNNDNLCQYIPASVETLCLSLDVDLAGLTHLTNLKDLTFTYFKNTSTTVHLDHATSLALSYWSRDDDLRFIERWTNLEELELVSPYESLPQTMAPSLLNLTLLTSLTWTLTSDNPNKAVHEIRQLTNLQKLQFFANEKERTVTIEDYSGLSVLTNLTLLAVIVGENFWIQLPQLTNLQFLQLSHVDDDDRLLLLTAMQNLTALQIKSASENFTGCHFTALTSLQHISVAGCDLEQLVLSEYDLMHKMPYLFLCELGIRSGEMKLQIKSTLW